MYRATDDSLLNAGCRHPDRSREAIGPRHRQLPAALVRGALKKVSRRHVQRTGQPFQDRHRGVPGPALYARDVGAMDPGLEGELLLGPAARFVCSGRQTGSVGLRKGVNWGMSVKDGLKVGLSCCASSVIADTWYHHSSLN